eukprot:TRINITY_DN4025_c0_g1_i1.p1 TRINITY_DN4025_c0_g1~~TRINITY_DN4025_c0_g1_i1.p1  ORF type:complete len:603 (-),score=141.31 TRINITY_DN4025_c0_g1_i1:59-1867(-)
MSSPSLVSLTAVFLVALFCVAVAQNENACAQYSSCSECIEIKNCGWCGQPVIYEDGSTGPHCAGKPPIGVDPPKGFKKWTCPVDYQNDACLGYVCSEDTFTCESAGSAGGGVPLEDCKKQCFPPTYECDESDYTCKQTEPGHGTDKPNCEANCVDPNAPEPSPAPSGSPGPSASPGPSGSPGPSSDPDTYVCDMVTGECVIGDEGLPKLDCIESCGKVTNSTPTHLIGDYRGFMVQNGYIVGEFQAAIQEDSIKIVDPNKSPYIEGFVSSVDTEVWINTSSGVRRGIAAFAELPQVGVLTWALGSTGGKAPSDFNTAMNNDTVFVLARCLNPQICQFDLSALAMASLAKRSSLQKEDPCAVNMDCPTCLSDPNACGFCSENVIYDPSGAAREGAQCASVNTTVAGGSILCPGAFSIEDCSAQQPSGSPGPSGSPSVEDVYRCDSATATCELVHEDGEPGTLPKDACEAQCVVNEGTPAPLKNTIWRGIQINDGYKEGEWVAQFDDDSLLTITDLMGNLQEYKISTVGRFVRLTGSSGDPISTLWQVGQTPVVKTLLWAWGEPGKEGPSDFTAAMVNDNQLEYFFISCLDGQDSCDFTPSLKN